MLDQNKSIYIQIAETIENDILNNKLLEGNQVPSTNQFAQLFQINPATAGKGVNLLVDEEILYKKRGLGMYVAEGAREKILHKRQRAFYEETLPRVIYESNRLQISREELIEAIENFKKGE